MAKIVEGKTRMCVKKHSKNTRPKAGSKPGSGPSRKGISHNIKIDFDKINFDEVFKSMEVERIKKEKEAKKKAEDALKTDKQCGVCNVNLIKETVQQHQFHNTNVMDIPFGVEYIYSTIETGILYCPGCGLLYKNLRR